MTTERLTVELGPRSYGIAIGQDMLGGLGAEVAGLCPSPTVALVTNPTVHALYGPPVRQSLESAGLHVIEALVPDGEEHKTIGSVEQILTRMLRARLDRRSLVVALGGGVIGDMAGFAASIYMRGIRFVQVPTTLLAQVDSSVGGKTGVNHPLGKNMIGAFWQPSLVWVDTGTLGTLPRRQMRAGLSEVIKYGVIWDEGFFDYLLGHRDEILALDPGVLAHVIKRSCEIKADVVSRDEREGGLRAILNYGHTIGHAVETATGYTRYLHGEAVAIGMCQEARLAVELGMMSAEEAMRVEAILGHYDLPTGLPEGVEPGALIDAMALDKKAVAGRLRFALPEQIGRARVDVAVEEGAVRKVVG